MHESSSLPTMAHNLTNGSHFTVYTNIEIRRVPGEVRDEHLYEEGGWDSQGRLPRGDNARAVLSEDNSS